MTFSPAHIQEEQKTAGLLRLVSAYFRRYSREPETRERSAHGLMVAAENISGLAKAERRAGRRRG